MNEPMRKYMKVGLVLFMAYPDTIRGEGPVAEYTRRVALDPFFEAVEVTWIHDQAAAAETRAIAELARLDLYYGGMPTQKLSNLNLNDLNAQNRKTALEQLKLRVDEAYRLGAQGFGFMSGRFEKGREEEAYRALTDSTRELCAYVKSKGNMRVSLEVFDYDIDNCSLLGPVELVRRFAAEISAVCPNFGLMVDLSHLPQLRETPVESLIPVKNYINHAHIGNAVIKNKLDPAYGDKHPRFGYPGGENDIDEITEYLRVLLAIGYLNQAKRPVLSIEVKPGPGEDPELVIANSKRALELAWLNVG
ncbi:MAG: sugar phosphate isomerase/epimerase [Gracilibacteraceae bacterium]|nr:sugar phosphate isomerase/epimerase [Gracilibacteraceae bacterium]